MLTIGFIGAGIMGKPMAANLIRAGFSVQVYNRTPRKLNDLIELGAKPAATPREAAKGAELVISIVSRTSDVQEVLLGKDGAIHGLKAGAMVIDMSTIDVRTTRHMGRHFAEAGIEFLDAPVSGGEIGAIEAMLTVFVGGSQQSFARAEPVFQAMGKTITHMGPVGSGQVAKACNQILVSVAVMAAAEALNYGAAEGLDLNTLISAASGGSAQSWVLEHLGKAMAEGEFAPGFMIDLMQKDLGMLIENAKSEQYPVPASELASTLFQQLQDKGLGGDGMQAMAKAYPFRDA